MKYQYPFQDPDLSIESRLEDVLKRLTCEEKCAQLRWNAPAIERLGIPAYNWWNEALHGVGRNGRATVFPQAIGMAAMWNPELTEQIASAIADEARAKHHAAVRKGSHQQYQGLTFWTPNINIFRDPRWGRGQETWGEDPYLTGELGAAFVRGLQGSDPKYLKTAACAKHFAVHSGPEKLRHEFNACPSEKDFRETYLPAFKRLVNEGVESVMGAYNAVYGEPCCGSKLLLQEILREEWGFNGHVVSDCWAIHDFHHHHKVTSSAEESAALALKNGCDLNCGSVFCEALEGALAMGLIIESDVERALRRLWRTRFKLGMFDPEARVPFTSIPMSVVNCDEHRNLAFNAAVEGTVLLKNRGNLLPIGAETKSILLSGPLTTSVDAMIGNYFGMSGRISSVFEGIANHAPEGLRVDFKMGCLLDQTKPNPAGWAEFEATKNDVVIVSMGLNSHIEGEEGDAIQSDFGGDRETIELLEDQRNFLRDLRKTLKKNKSDTRVVLLLFGGSAIALPGIDEYADAVLQVWYPGEAGGDAIAAILFGKATPGGRLPVTIPKSTKELPPYEDYSMNGRTYRYMDESSILFPFGFGLSFTEFSYSNLVVKANVERSIELSFRVENVGDRDGKEVAQLYLSGPDQADLQPYFKLVRFAPMNLEPGEVKTVQWILQEEDLSFIDGAGTCRFESGNFKVTVGGAAPYKMAQALGAPTPISTTLEIN